MPLKAGSMQLWLFSLPFQLLLWPFAIVKDGNIVQALSQAQAHAIDAWSYSQAKSTKQSLAENSLELVKTQHVPGSDSVIKKYEEKIARYEKEKAEIKILAEGYAKEYYNINVFDDQFDMTEAFHFHCFVWYHCINPKEMAVVFCNGSKSAGNYSGTDSLYENQPAFRFYLEDIWVRNYCYRKIRMTLKEKNNRIGCLSSETEFSRTVFLRIGWFWTDTD